MQFSLPWCRRHHEISGKKGSQKAEGEECHPPIEQMVNAAIAALMDRKGSSLPSIKKYIAANNKRDVQKLAPCACRYEKKARV